MCDTRTGAPWFDSGDDRSGTLEAVEQSATTGYHELTRSKS